MCCHVHVCVEEVTNHDIACVEDGWSSHVHMYALKWCPMINVWVDVAVMYVWAGCFSGHVHVDSVPMDLYV